MTTKRPSPAQRQADILGDGPRIAPLRPDEMDEFAMTMHHRIREVANRDLAPRTIDNLPEFVTTLLRHPALFEKHTAFGLQLLGAGTIPARARELVILRMAWLCGAPYEFGEHILLGRDAGIDAADVAALKVGSSDPHWPEQERALLCAVDELHSDAMISDATWAALAERFAAPQMIELVVLIGHYQTMAYLLNSLRMRLHGGNEGLLAM